MRFIFQVHAVRVDRRGGVEWNEKITKFSVRTVSDSVRLPTLYGAGDCRLHN